MLSSTFKRVCLASHSGGATQSADAHKSGDAVARVHLLQRVRLAIQQALHERAERTRGTASDLVTTADDVAGGVETLRRQINRLIAEVRAA